MSRGFSIWLDLLRVAAALAVLFGHIAHTRFTGGDYAILRELNIASDAVIVFFVISGVVIAHAARRDGSAGLYAFNRVTRLLTVIIPALALTALLDAIGTRIDASAYPAPYYVPAATGDFLLRGLSLSTEWTGLFERVRLGTNGPLWSLSFEAAYYVMFGLAVFARGILRLIALALVALVVGLPILALMPAWLLGVAVWHALQREDIAKLSPLLAVALAVGLPVALVWARIAGLPEALSALTATALAPASHHDLLGYSDEVLWNLVIAVSIVLHLLGMARLFHSAHLHEQARWVRGLRWFAGGTFSIYAIHYPVLHLLDATLPDSLPGHDALMLGLTIGAGLAFAAVFERPIKRYRLGLRSLLRRPQRVTATPPAQ